MTRSLGDLNRAEGMAGAPTRWSPGLGLGLGLAFGR